MAGLSDTPQFYSRTLAELQAQNRIWPVGYPVYAYDTEQLFIGDGVTAFSSLPTAGGSGSVPQNNYTATADPTVNDDESEGYSIGSKWYNSNSGEAFLCVDATDGAAVWVKISLTVDELGSMAFEDTTDYYAKTDFASAPTVDAPIVRDAAGRAQVVDPSVDADIATKGSSDTKAEAEAGAVQTNLTTHENDTSNPHQVTAAQAGADPAGSASTVQTNLDDHEAEESAGVHGATDAATANKIIIRDANGRAKVADPDVDADIATKKYVDDNAGGGGISVPWMSAVQVGNGLTISGIIGGTNTTAMNSTDVAFIDEGNTDLRLYRFDGTDWAQVGNELNISGAGWASLSALNSTDVAFVSAAGSLRVYRFDGTDWAQVGNSLGIAGASIPVISALNGTDVAFIDRGNDDLRTYRFDGTDWAQVGNDLNITGVGFAAIAALNDTDVAFCDFDNKDLRVYRFDGTDWAQVGNDLNLPGIGTIALAALNGTDVAFIDSTNDDLRVYRFDGTDWTQVGKDFAVGTASTSSLSALNGTDVVFIDSGGDELRLYRFDPSIFTFSPPGPPG